MCVRNVSFHSSYIAFLFFPFPTMFPVASASIENLCSSDLDCPNEKACINDQCVDPCALRGACGENALCRAVLHKPRCSCPECYVGTPQRSCQPDLKCEATARPDTTPKLECIYDSDCADSLACNRAVGECQDPCKGPNTIACDTNKRCEVRRHQPVCMCKAGFIVSESGELACAPDRRTECRRDDECASNRACIDARCQNPCTALRNPPCSGPGKSCDVLEHRPVCICTENCNPTLSICLRDNGCPTHQACRSYRCIDPCKNVTCADDAPCFVEEHKPVCKFCPQGFVSDPKFGCLKGNFFESRKYINL